MLNNRFRKYALATSGFGSGTFVRAIALALDAGLGEELTDQLGVFHIANTMTGKVVRDNIAPLLMSNGVSWLPLQESWTRGPSRSGLLTADRVDCDMA